MMEEYYRRKWFKLAYMCQMKRAALNISYQKRALEGEWLRRLVYIALQLQLIHTVYAISQRFWDFICN